MQLRVSAGFSPASSRRLTVNTIWSVLDLFDFLNQLSIEHGDTDYIKILEEYTRFVVQLRIAQAMVEDSGNLVKEGGKIPLKDLIELIGCCFRKSL